MKRFAALFNELDASTSTLAKVDALKRYFAAAAPADAAWAAYFLAGGKPRQVVPSGALRALACQRAGVDDWLFDECYQAVGDLAETIAHVLPPAADTSNAGLADWIEQRLLPLRELPPEAQMARIGAYWDELDSAGRFLLTKLIGGGFRVGVSRLLVQRALAEHAGIDAKVVAQRMMGFTDKATAPDAASYARLLSTDAAPERDAGQPYPFFLAHSVETALGGAAAAASTREIASALAAGDDDETPPAAPAPPAAPTGTPAAAGSALLDRFDAQLGDPSDWLVEWKYDGIRAQVVRRAGGTWIWSRGEDLVTDRFPEVVALADALPDGTVLDGEIVVWKNDAPASFNLLQQRIGRKTLTKKVLADAPAGFIAYDLLEWQGEDLREQPQRQRRAQLETVAASAGIRVSPAVALPAGESGWRALASVRQASRERGVEGFMLKHQASRYGVGRRKQAATADGGGTGWGWLKWKIDPLSVDAVLIYAQAGHGRRASVYTDYTFAVWNRTPVDAAEARAVVDAIVARKPAEPGALQLVPFAKAYSGLTDVEFTRIDRVIRATTLEKFGPVRSVKPTLVFELGFEGINRSPRHKSGIAVRFPRMLRIRDDKPLHEADTLAALEALLAGTDTAGAAGADLSSNAASTAPTEDLP